MDDMDSVSSLKATLKLELQLEEEEEEAKHMKEKEESIEEEPKIDQNANDTSEA